MEVVLYESMHKAWNNNPCHVTVLIFLQGWLDPRSLDHLDPLIYLGILSLNK